MSYLVQTHSTTNLRSAKAHSVVYAGLAVGTAAVRIGQRASGLMPAASVLQPTVAAMYGYTFDINSIDSQHDVVKVGQT